MDLELEDKILNKWNIYTISQYSIDAFLVGGGRRRRSVSTNGVILGFGGGGGYTRFGVIPLTASTAYSIVVGSGRLGYNSSGGTGGKLHLHLDIQKLVSRRNKWLLLSRMNTWRFQ